MKNTNLKYIVCPLTQIPLKITVSNTSKNKIINAGLSNLAKKLNFSIANAIPVMIYPLKLVGPDKEFNKKYEKGANIYDIGMKWLFDSFFETEDNVRNKLIDLLHLKKEDFVLNVGCGTGADSTYILERLSKKGKLFNVDISSALIQIAQKKVKDKMAISEFIIANAAYLPFPNDTFNCVFHFGGINEFTNKKKSITEMLRVTKPGGRIVFGDESAAPWLTNKRFGKIIKTANPLYKHKPPIHLLPDNAQNVSIHYLLGNSFYAIAFNKGEKSCLNLDLEIPGKRGGTLRSRFETSKKINKPIS